MLLLTDKKDFLVTMAQHTTGVIFSCSTFYWTWEVDWYAGTAQKWRGINKGWKVWFKFFLNLSISKYYCRAWSERCKLDCWRTSYSCTLLLGKHLPATMKSIPNKKSSGKCFLQKLKAICKHVTYLTFFIFSSHSFMFELLSKLNINLSTKDQVLEVLEKCNTLLVGGEAAVLIPL